MRVILETITGRKGIKNFSSLEEYVDFMTKNGDKIKNIVESDLPYDDKPVSVAAPSQSNGWEQVNKATFGDVIKKAEKGDCVLPHKAASVFKDEAKFEPSKASEKADSQEGDVPQFKYDEPKSEEPKEEKVEAPKTEAPKSEEPKEAPKSEEKEDSEDDKEKKEEIDEGFKDKFKKAVATGAVAASLAAGNAHGMAQDPYYDGATRPFEDSYEQVSDYEMPKIKEVRKDGTIVDQYGNAFTKSQWESLLRGEDPFADGARQPFEDEIEECLRIAGVQLNEAEDDILELDEYDSNPLEDALDCVEAAMDDFGGSDDEYLRSVCEDCAKEYGVDVKKLYHAYTGHKWSALDSDEDYNDVEEDVNNPEDGEVDEKSGKEKLFEEGDDEITLEKAKENLKYWKNQLLIVDNGDDFAYSNGKHDRVQRQVDYWNNKVKELSSAPKEDPFAALYAHNAKFMKNNSFEHNVGDKFVNIDTDEVFKIKSVSKDTKQVKLNMF